MLSKIETVDDRRLAGVNNIYMSSFPEKERRPWASILRLVESRAPFFSLYVVKGEGGEVEGFATAWRLPGAVYIEHLAVAAPSRGGGMGGALLDAVTATAAGMPVVVEVELPDADDYAPRRIAFYERHGFTAMADYTYFQPPYAPGLPDVQLMLMTTGEIADVNAFVVMLHTLVYK